MVGGLPEWSTSHTVVHYCTEWRRARSISGKLHGYIFFTEESDDEDERPSRRRRMAERAAEGAEDEEVKQSLNVQCTHNIERLMLINLRTADLWPCRFRNLLLPIHRFHQIEPKMVSNCIVFSLKAKGSQWNLYQDNSHVLILQIAMFWFYKARGVQFVRWYTLFSRVLLNGGNRIIIPQRKLNFWYCPIL